MKDITIGLNYLHNRKPSIIMHRDLKPDNIRVNEYGCVKIADFGISKLIFDNVDMNHAKHTGETPVFAVKHTKCFLPSRTVPEISCKLFPKK